MCRAAALPPYHYVRNQKAGSESMLHNLGRGPAQRTSTARRMRFIRIARAGAGQEPGQGSGVAHSRRRGCRGTAISRESRRGHRRATSPSPWCVSRLLLPLLRTLRSRGALTAWPRQQSPPTARWPGTTARHPTPASRRSSTTSSAGARNLGNQAFHANARAGARSKRGGFPRFRRRNLMLFA